MTKDVNEVTEKGDLLDSSGKEGEDENTLEETVVIGSAGSENEAKGSEEAEKKMEEQVEKKMEEEHGNDSKEEKEEEETKVDMNKKVEPEIETSEIKCVGEIKKEKETLPATGGQFELVTKDETTDEKTGESKNGTEVKSGTAEKILNGREGECGDIGPEEDIGAEKEDTTELGKEENADNARSELPSAEETDPAETSSDQIEPKFGDGGLDKLHKLEPIWMKR